MVHMSQNILQEGKPRIGWMIDGDHSTPEIAVMLELTEDAVQLTIPTKGLFGSEDPYTRWFGSGILYGDDPDRTRYRYSPPHHLLFYDHLGSVVLVGCRASASSSSSNGAGFGRIIAEYAVLGERGLDLDKINGIRTEMPGLAAWTGITSRTSAFTTDSKNHTRSFTVTMSSPDATKLSRRKNLALSPSWSTSTPVAGTQSTRDFIQLVTATRRAEDWDEHLALHRAVQMLLSLSAWREFGYSRVEVAKMRQVGSRSHQPLATERDIAWSEVVTHRLPKHEQWATSPRFLFRYDDIGAVGVARWLRIRDQYERAMLPLASVIGQHSMFLEAAVLQTGIAVEALGYQIASQATPPKLNSRGQIAYTDAMDAILADMSVIPVPDIEGWKLRSRLSYMGVKHADNRTPDMLTLANAYRENALVMRYWLAAKLG